MGSSLSTTHKENQSYVQKDYLSNISQNADQKCFNNRFSTDISSNAQSHSFDIFSNDRETTIHATSTPSSYSSVDNINNFGIGNGSFGIFNRSSDEYTRRPSDNFHQFRKNKLSLEHGISEYTYHNQETNSAKSQNAEKIRSTEQLRFPHARHKSIIDSYPSTYFMPGRLPKQTYTTAEIQYAMHRNTIFNQHSHPNIHRDGVILREISKDPSPHKVYPDGKSSEERLYLRNDKTNGKSLKRINNPDWYNDGDGCKKTKVAKIDEIFDIFVPAMGATSINESFIIKLINLHKNKSNETDEVMMLSPLMRGGPAAGVFVGETTNAYSTLTKEDVLDHFLSLQESFVKFACSNKAFKELCVGDRTELLKSNSILFVMVSTRLSSLMLWPRSSR